MYYMGWKEKKRWPGDTTATHKGAHLELGLGQLGCVPFAEKKHQEESALRVRSSWYFSSCRTYDMVPHVSLSVCKSSKENVLTPM